VRLESHLEQAFWEDYEFLKEQGMADEQIARRLGVSDEALEKRLSRREKKR
jgi:orotate phosphoribosyltransferase-like protein